MRWWAVLLIGCHATHATPSQIDKIWFDGDKTRVGEVAKAAARGDREAIRALGRLGGDQAVLAGQLGSAAGDDAGVSLGILARNKVVFTDDVKAKILAAPDGYGKAYALAYGAWPAAAPALGALAKSEDPEIRALAARGLGSAGVPSEALLQDPDARVRVEAVRALSTDASTPDQRVALAKWLVSEWDATADLPERLTGDRVHPILEGLSRLAPHVDEKPVHDLYFRLAEETNLGDSTASSRYTPDIIRPIDAVSCLSAAALARAPDGSLDALVGCGDPSGGGWPIFMRRQLVADLITEKPGLAGAKDVVEKMWTDHDDRVRGAAAAAAVAIGDEQIVRAAIDDADLVVAGSVGDALATAAEKNPPPAWAVEATRAAATKQGPDGGDAELFLTRLELLVTAKDAASKDLLEKASGSPNAAVREKARDGLAKLTGKDPGVIAPSAKPALPPSNPALVTGKKVTMTVDTNKGTFTIALDPKIAPWNVSTMSTLTRRGAYDGTIWHRVVPDFVAQGGDPTGSGWGGPGYDVPEEPSSTRYERGTVGIADAGRDTGGSQFFISLTRTPHLEGRYTIVGKVTDGMDVVDRLVVGDRITKATVEIQ
jgi:cyclophilin family peptidyl-prolyl cis-trans isomerase